MKCKRCKKEQEAWKERIGQIVEDMFEADPNYDKAHNDQIDNHYSHFLRVNYKIDGIEEICSGCYIDLWDEFWADVEEQKVIMKKAIQKMKESLE